MQINYLIKYVLICIHFQNWNLDTGSKFLFRFVDILHVKGFYREDFDICFYIFSLFY